jgi:PAS domain S-box-containing protein
MKRILLVEDEAIIALAAQGDLQDLDYDVSLAHSGEEAILACEREGPFDLVLMDIDLGRGMDGTEAAAAILARRDLPVLFMSGHSEREIVERTERITSYGYVVKGSSPTAIDASIKMALKLFDAKRMFQAVLDANPQYICWKDRRSVLMGCNKNHATLLGLPDTESIIGKTDWELHRGEEEIRGFIKDDVDVMESGIPLYNIKEKALYLDGRERLLETNKVPLRDSRGEVRGIMIAYSDITERKKDEERIHALLEEKELILHEVQHRMKNDLITIGALLSLRASKSASIEAEKALREAADSIQSMAVLYEKLSGAQGIRELPVKNYLTDFIAQARGKYIGFEAFRIELEAEDFMLPTKLLRPLGMILNELIANAMKHAFEGRQEGRIEVSAFTRGRVARISVRDDGIGLPDSIDFDDSPGFGLTLVRAMAVQLDGRVSIERGTGTAIALEFPF